MPRCGQRLPLDQLAQLDFVHLPTDVGEYYGDAIKVLRAGVPDAAAVQLRRTLEAAASHVGVIPFPLVKATKR
jgi:hypothetical protein